jgi:hypothetical protein
MVRYGRFSALLALLLLILSLWRCGVFAQIDFRRQCRSIARIEVKNPALWRQYLLERRQYLRRSKVTVNGVEIDPTDLWPIIANDHFFYTTEWVMHGKASVPKNKPFRNDAYLYLNATGEPVARFHDLRLSYDTIETTMSDDCTSKFPELYTGSRPHRGPIMSVGR